MSKTQTAAKKKYTNGFIFVLAMWLLSRLSIITVMHLIAPAIIPDAVHSNPNFVEKLGWARFSGWDGTWYQKIATTGYEYADDLKQHSIAFFPLYPLVTRGVMSLGLSFATAGTLVNSTAFLGALLIAYHWVEDRHGVSAARWVTAVLAWCPLSIFGLITYTEGLFLLLSTAALQAFDNHQYRKAAFFGVLTTATRITGAPLMPTFLLVAWRERRGAIAYVTAFATLGGLLLFSAYCAIRFGNPLAFVHAQRGWQSHTGFNLTGWWDLLTQDLLLRKGTSTALFALTKVVAFFGGTYLLWYSRAKISRVAIAYGFCSVAMIIASGSVLSIERFVYAIVPIEIALGLLLSAQPIWGCATIGLFFSMLVYYSVRSSWGLWIG
ncbi:MAG: hypothetical protein H0U45_16465 [Tatlockia sp.]|nr:hypothetical protein [Tatlockia sp.]